MAFAVWQATIVDESGNVQSSASIEVRREETGALAAIYEDRDGNTPLSNPFTADEDGFARFYSAGGALKITATLGEFSRTWRHVPIGLLGELDHVLSTAVKHERTAAEIAAGVTPVARNFPELDAERYGIVFDDESAASSNTEILNTLGAAAWPGAVKLHFSRQGSTLYFDDQLSFTSGLVGLSFAPNVTMRYVGPATKPAIVFRSNTVGISGLRLENGTSHAWDNFDFVGLRVYDTRAQLIEIQRIIGFTINTQLWGVSPSGASAGIAFNDFRVVRSYDCVIHIDINSREAQGWINENRFFVALDLTSSFPTNVSAYGVRFTAASGGYRNCNNNVFEKPCIELEDGDNGIERIPVWFDNCGTRNVFNDARIEGGRGALMRVDSDTFAVNNNRVNALTMIGSAFTGSNLQWVQNTDGGLGYGNYVFAPFFNGEQLPAWSSGNLVEKSFPYSSSRLRTDGVFYQAASSADETEDGIGEITKDFILIAPSNRALGVYIDTAFHKEFQAALDVNDTFGRDWAITCYDGEGNILDDSDPGHPHVAASEELTGNSTFGYSYVSASNRATRLQFRVGSHVAKVKLLVVGRVEVRGIHVMAFPHVARHYGLGVSCGFRAGELIASDSPATIRNGGYTPRGTFVYNADAAAGAPIGWQCVTAGWNASAWEPETSYVAGQLRENDTGKVYVCRVAGISAGSGGPTGTGTGITDGGVTWDYVGTLATWTAGPSNPS